MISRCYPRFWILLAICAVFAGRSATAANIYRWTDADGQVHYGQREPEHAGAEKIELPGSGGGRATRDAEAAARRARQQRLLDAYEYERERKAVRAVQAAEEQRARAKRCDKIKVRWRGLMHPGPIFTKRPDGSRDYLSDAQRKVQLERLRPAYIQACGEAP